MIERIDRQLRGMSGGERVRVACEQIARIRTINRQAEQLAVQDVCRNQPRTGAVVVGSWAGGGAWARPVVSVGCARALSLILVLGPVWLWVGDMMVGGVIPRGYVLRPVGL